MNAILAATAITLALTMSAGNVMATEKLPESAIVSISDGKNAVQCRISWQYLPTGYIGHGDWHSLEHKDMLQAHVDKLKKQHPEMTHWIEYK